MASLGVLTRRGSITKANGVRFASFGTDEIALQGRGYIDSGRGTGTPWCMRRLQNLGWRSEDTKTGMPSISSKPAPTGDRGFESYSLQPEVMCEPLALPRRFRLPAFPRGYASRACGLGSQRRAGLCRPAS